MRTRGERVRAPVSPRVLVLSSVFPNVRQPAFGVFIQERLRRVARRCDVTVVAPLPWFPFNRLIRGSKWSGIPRSEPQPGLGVVQHPWFFCVPRYAKWLDGFFYAASLLPYLLRLRRRVLFDVIDAHFSYPDGVAAVLLGKVLRRPVLITLRGSIVRLAGYPLHRPQIRWALRSADRVLAVSDSLKRTAMALGIPAEHIRVIPNGVDTEHFFPMDRTEARAALDLPADRTILLSVGGLNEGKGHHRIIQMMPALLQRRPDLLYVIVGGEQRGSSYRPVLARLVRELGLEQRVLVAGERAHAEIPRWLAASDLFCLATRSEGWANVLLEALACGRPVVTTRVGGNAEIVTHAGLGLLVPPGDDSAFREAVLEALARSWDPAALVAHARRHSWETAAEQVLEEFRRLAPGSDRPGTDVSISRSSRG
jgi:glycosyltransferase involved in cell wall biosynthesis